MRHRNVAVVVAMPDMDRDADVFEAKPPLTREEGEVLRGRSRPVEGARRYESMYADLICRLMTSMSDCGNWPMVARMILPAIDGRARCSTQRAERRAVAMPAG